MSCSYTFVSIATSDWSIQTVYNLIIVITPLTALMKDQVKRNLFSFCANYIVSTPDY